MHAQQVSLQAHSWLSHLSCYSLGSLLYTITALSLTNVAQLDVSSVNLLLLCSATYNSLDLLHRFTRRVGRSHGLLADEIMTPIIYSALSLEQPLSPSAMRCSVFVLYLRRFT